MSNTLADPSKEWTPGEWVGGTVTITSGTGAGQSRGIVSNTETELTLDAEWTVEPSGFTYHITLSLLTGVVRGQAETSPAAHSAGSLVLEVVTGGYTFIIAGHACRSVSNVKVDGILQAGGYTVELANTTLIPGRTLCLVRIANVSEGGLVQDPSFRGEPGFLTVRTAGVVNSGTCSALASIPGFLKRGGPNRPWRARVALAVTFDAGATAEAGAPGFGGVAVDTIRVQGPGLQGIAGQASAEDDAGTEGFKRVRVITAATEFEFGGEVRQDVTVRLIPDNVNSGGVPGYTGVGTPCGTIELPFLGIVGSVVITGLTVEWDYLPEDVLEDDESGAGASGVSVTSQSGAPTTGSLLLEQFLRRIQVTCDVEGFTDDSGTLTGVVGTLVELPGDIDRHLGSVLLGESLSIFDAASYAATRLRHLTLGYKHNLVINQPTQLQALFASSARQSRCWVFSDGGTIYRVFLEKPVAPVVRIEPRHYRERYPTWFSTDRSFIRTVFAMLYSFRWAPGIFRRLKNFAQAGLGNLYPTIQAVEGFPYVPDSEVMASDLLAYDIGFFTRPHRIVEVQTFWNHLALEVGDVIGFAFPSELGVGVEGFRTWDDGAGAWWDQPQYQWDQAVVLDPQSMNLMWQGLMFRIYALEWDHGRNTLDLKAVEEV